MNRFINNPILPFLDLEHPKALQSDVLSEDESESLDGTLLFMTLAVTLTAENEMPIVAPYTGRIPEDKDVIGFYRTSKNSPRTTVPHFFFSDKKIRAYWSKPFLTEKKLERFACSISLDFSMTQEMSKTQKMYSSFLNKLWASWLQSRGHLVIPNVSFPDEWWENYWLEGWPKHSVIAVSSIGVLRHGNPKEWLRGMYRIQKELQPLHIIRYGSKIPGENEDNRTFILNDNKRAANGW